ncbi:MAG: hypothetical protein WKF71_14750 [Pyrinomonadaceae bacterium]
MKKTSSKIIAVLAFIAFFSSIIHAQKISTEEQKIIEYIDTHANDVVALLEKTVNIESPTENLAGVKQVGMVFKEEFESIGFTAKWLEMPAEMKRAGHLLAEKPEQKANEFCCSVISIRF